MQTVEMTHELRGVISDMLARAPLFRSLGPREIGSVVGAATLVQFEPGEALFRHGDKSDAFHLLVAGEAAFQVTREDEPIEIARVGPPELLGVVAVLMDEPQNATVVAGDKVVALRFDATTFWRMFQELPDFGIAVARGLASRLKELAGRVPLPRYEAEAPPDRKTAGMLPLAFLERHRVVPLEVQGNLLTLGFVDDPTSQALEGVRQLLPGRVLRPVAIASTLYDSVLGSLSGAGEWGAAEDPAVESPPASPSQAGGGSPELDRWIQRMAAEGVSDLHLTEGRRPRWRLDGRLVEIADAAIIGAGTVRSLFERSLDERRGAEFGASHDVDFGYSLPGVARVRVNMYRDNHGVSSAMRLISNRISTFEQLGLPTDLTRFCEHPKGLVLVTGPTGSGKSTTLAAMIDHINRTRPVHVITIEDPIEFVHANQTALITQREVGSQAAGFERALRAALRQDPDVIRVGEMRDTETVQLALEAANTGHLVFSTLHTNSAVTTVDRIVDLFDSSRQEQIRSSLAESLLGVVSQTLCRRIGGGRVAALEVLVVNHAIANLIREGKTSQLVTAMQTARKEGNRLMNAELAALVRKGVVTREEALAHSTEQKELERLLAGASAAHSARG
jgi:twitching motility protein PilT